MNLIERIEFWHNTASDTKFVWFPFHFLKPNPNVEIGAKLRIKMTICFGLYYGIFAAIRSCLFSDLKIGTTVAKDVPLAVLFFAVWFSFVTAPLWNMRAKRLKNINHS